MRVARINGARPLVGEIGSDTSGWPRSITVSSPTVTQWTDLSGFRPRAIRIRVDLAKSIAAARGAILSRTCSRPLVKLVDRRR